MSDPAKDLLREFRLFRDAMRGEINDMRGELRAVCEAVIELNKTVRSVPGLIDVANEQDQHARALEARLRVVEEDQDRQRKRNGGSPR